jgi:N-carbamoylputrescine amidase
MKVTVCELRDDPQGLALDWGELVTYIKTAGSELVLLPEMPFAPWFAHVPTFDPLVWQASVNAHDHWQERLPELASAMVLGARPVTLGERRLNEGFAWTPEQGYRPAHYKYYLPDEPGYWEASWYQRGDGAFQLIESRGCRIGFMICTELWFNERARAYGKAGANLLVHPRTTELATVEKWLTGGRAAAIVSGAYSLSSNRASGEGQPTTFGGSGWIVGPDGQVLGVTSRQQPFVTVEIDLNTAEQAKKTYPRYVSE